MNIDVKDATTVQEALDKVVQGIGLRLTLVNQNITLPMARAKVEEIDGKPGLHILPMDIDGRDFYGSPLDAMETIDNGGLHFVCGNWEYTIHPLGGVAPALIEAGRTYEQRLEAERQDEADTYAAVLAAQEKSMGK